MHSHVVSVTLCTKANFAYDNAASRTDKLLSATHHKTQTMHRIHVSDGFVFFMTFMKSSDVKKICFSMPLHPMDTAFILGACCSFFTLSPCFLQSVCLWLQRLKPHRFHTHTRTSYPLCLSVKTYAEVFLYIHAL